MFVKKNIDDFPLQHVQIVNGVPQLVATPLPPGSLPRMLAAGAAAAQAPPTSGAPPVTSAAQQQMMQNAQQLEHLRRQQVLQEQMALHHMVILYLLCLEMQNEGLVSSLKRRPLHSVSLDFAPIRK